MKTKLMEIVLTCKAVEPLTFQADLLAVGVFSDSRLPIVEKLNARLDKVLDKLQQQGDFEAAPAATALIYSTGRISAFRILFVGLGKKSDCDQNTVRKAVSMAAKTAVDLKAKTAGLLFPMVLPRLEKAQVAQVLSEGAFFGAYRYDEYLEKKDTKRPDKIHFTTIFEDIQTLKECQNAFQRGIIIGAAQNTTRTLANRPPNVINPRMLAAEAKRLCASIPALSCRILDVKQLTAKKMGGILSVGQGSATPPALIVLHYRPTRRAASDVFGLVGKAITFDSGGISLKPGEGLHDMKFDKSGGMAVLGTLLAAAQLKVPLELYGLIPTAENMPSGSSYRPGDIITTYSGKTVEIQNTDAEGRLLLADAITYAQQLGCKTIVDVATLTGACVVAIGKKRAGLMTNDSDLAEQIKKAAEFSGERVWPLPCDDEFVEEMKSKVASLKNIGSKWGAACAAGAFLSQFAQGVRWAHLDIAGPGVWGADEKDPAGSVGFGVRLLTYWLMLISQQKQ